MDHTSTIVHAPAAVHDRMAEDVMIPALADLLEKNLVGGADRFVVERILYAYDLPRPVVIKAWQTARYTYQHKNRHDAFLSKVAEDLAVNVQPAL